MKKRTISMLLVLLMILSTAGTCVFADVDEPQTEGATVVTEADAGADVDLVGDHVASEPKNESAEDSVGFSVTAAKNGTTDATVTWTGAPEGSKVRITPLPEGGDAGDMKTFNGAAGTAPITGLTPATTYKFLVELLDAEGNPIVDVEGNPIAITTNSIKTDAEKIVPDKPAVATYSAYNSVALEWGPVADAAYYNVYRDGSLVQNRVTSRSVFDPSMCACICYGINDDSNHSFQVEAVSSDGSVARSDVRTDARVSRMYIRITFKQKKTLKSHDGSKTKYTFKKGQTVNAFGFGSGQYYFTYNVRGRDCTFYVNYGRVRKPTALYTRSFNYNEREAEYFVLTTGKGSSTSRLIWANLYTQHIYLFTRVNGLWRVNSGTYSNWECSSGKASSPSPTGLSFTIKNKYKRHSSTRFWNTYKGQAAIHGQVNKTYGKPLSHGCIRNPNAKAEFIFKNYPKKTRVMVY